MKNNRLAKIINNLTHKRLNMNFSVFRQKYRDSENTKTVFMLSTLLLLCLVILQQCKINSQHERLVVVPPTLTKKAEIAWNSSNQNYLNDFALYLASQISSTTPQTVDYVVGAMEGYFHPQIWSVLKPQLLTIRDNPNYMGLNPINHFTPTGGVIYEPETNKIFVVGELRSSAYGRQGGLETLGTIGAIYEMKLVMNGGLPKVVEWYAYTGNQPLTQEFKAKNAPAYEKGIAERQVVYLPMVADSQIQRESNQNTITIGLDQPQNPNQQAPVEALQPSVPQPATVQTQENIDPFADAANAATVQLQQNPQQTNGQVIQQPQQPAVAPAAPAVILPNNQNAPATPMNDDDPL